MEKSFIATENSSFTKDYNDYFEKEKLQKKFINKFFDEVGIETSLYMINGDGRVNAPFDEYNKSKIKLSIQPTDSDKLKFGNKLTVENKHGLCTFKKNTDIAKKFAQKCIDEQIIINLYKPRVSDYFSSLGWNGCRWQMFYFNDNCYLKIESDFLKEDDIPEGFIPIKISEYYQIQEEFEKQNKE